jgi:DNA-binding LytR/AlgR family response regulator
MVMIGLANGETLTQFVVRPFFPGPAVAWQLLQGLTFYAVVAALIYLRAHPPASAVMLTGALPQPDPGQKKELSRYFIRAGEDIHPVDVSQIVSIAGADDYAQVTTLTGSHLVSMTLTEFENALSRSSFIRVHRSRIVNADRIARAEPAGGGRVLLHMENGEMIQCSRTGTRLLKDRVI